MGGTYIALFHLNRRSALQIGHKWTNGAGYLTVISRPAAGYLHNPPVHSMSSTDEQIKCVTMAGEHSEVFSSVFVSGVEGDQHRAIRRATVGLILIWQVAEQLD